MRKFGLLLILLALFLVACGSGGSGTPATGQAENEEPAAAPTTDQPAGTQQDRDANTPTAGSDGDPAQVRERDWRQGNVTDPAVTIIEYGDFQ